jgi:phage terminase small subunit
MARSRKTTVAPVEHDGELTDALDELLPPPSGAAPGGGLATMADDFEMDGLPQDNAKSRELAAQMQSRLSGKPIFPYPPELKDRLKPYWMELVNSHSKDHFQMSDVSLMKMYCQCAYDIERQTELIDEEGEVVIGGRGQPIVNPRCKARESNRSTLLALATKFRSQPASRTNTENFNRGQGKAQQAGRAAQNIDEGDGLLAGRGMH